MKRSGQKLKLERKLAFVRTTVRQLNPEDLQLVNGGDYTDPSDGCPSGVCYEQSAFVCCTPDYTD